MAFEVYETAMEPHRCMNKFRLYLPQAQDQDVHCERWKHLFKQIDVVYNEVRIYEQGLDFTVADTPYNKVTGAPHELPYATWNGKKKAFDNLWVTVLGEKEIDES